MAIETTKDSLCINQIIEQKSESVVVEGDSIIPDIKPDILSVISTVGTICIYKKEILDGKVKIDGSINTYIMYLADDEDGSIRSINTNVDFTRTIEMSKINADMILDTDLLLKNIECRVINGRKVNIKAIIDVSIKVSANENLDIINNVKMKNIQMLNTSININSLVGNGNTKVYAKDTINIDNIDNLAEIMKTEINVINKDVKISYNKVLAKSDMNVKILYLTEDNRMNSVQSTIPIMGFIDIQNIAEDNICDIKYEIRNILIKPNSVEDHSVYVEVEMEIYCSAYQNQELKLIQDLYCPNRNITFTQRQIRVMQKKDTVQNTCNIREKQQIAELQGRKILDVAVHPEIEKQTLLTNRVLYEGEISFKFIYDLARGNSIDSKQIKVPFSFGVDFDGVNQNSKVDTMLEVSMQDFIVTADDMVDIKVDLDFTTSMARNTQINIIDDIKEENKDIITYSMIVYFTKNGDTLWKIAKKYGSTVEEIARVNGIENVDKLNVGQQLFIPRYNG